MPINDKSAGAMPAWDGAMPPESYATGPIWAAYRLPFPGASDHITARQAGIGFEGDAGAGANPGQGDAGGAPGTGDPPPPAPAKGDDGLGDAGKRALDQERAARKVAEKAASDAAKRIEELELATKSDADKAIEKAKKDGAAEASARLAARLRQTEVRSALTAAGLAAALVDLAMLAPEFVALKVDDDGAIEGLEDAIKGFKAAKADLFKVPAAGGSADGGVRNGGGGLTMDQVKKMSPDEINARWDEVQRTLSAK